ncbi:MAG: methylated-DNA--[protein]-cysteine S-methyltransferase [Chloroflexi bacterium]|nr:methylated-DNA--[protein]-cysteine S-methyltransferase [Chloroflexota bacterium]
MASLYYAVFETRLGWMSALASSRGLRRTTLPMATPGRCVLPLNKEIAGATFSSGTFLRLREKLNRFFCGEPVIFDEPLDLEDAPPFFKAAWKACQSIPLGETRSYRWLASQAGRATASRAAGQAMARNRLPIIVPCHRVIGTDGSLCGFGSRARELELKQELLNIEAEAAKNLREKVALALLKT